MPLTAKACAKALTDDFGTHDTSFQDGRHRRWYLDTGKVIIAVSAMERTNGLLRQYLPKRADLSSFSQQELDDIAWMLNTRPRKSLSWKCPAERFLPEDAFDFKAYWADKLNLVALGP